MHIAQVASGIGILRIQAHRLFQQRQGFVDLSVIQQRPSEIIDSAGIVRLPCSRLAVQGNGLIQTIDFLQNIGETQGRIEATGLHAGRFAPESEALLKGIGGSIPFLHIR
jgi:hypothetical protein